MSRSTEWGTSRLLLGLSAVLGLVWWAAMWSRGVPETAPAVVRYFVQGFALLQILAWLAVFVLVRRSQHEVTPSGGASAALLLALALTAGNALYWFTPALGAPVLVLALLGSLAVLGTGSQDRSGAKSQFRT